MDLELFKTGCLIMIIGMGIVFLFLWVMVYAMELSTKVLGFINKFMPEEIEEDKYVSKKKSAKNDNNEEIAVAIACAVAERSRA